MDCVPALFSLFDTQDECFLWSIPPVGQKNTTFLKSFSYRSYPIRPTIFVPADIANVREFTILRSYVTPGKDVG